MPDSSAIATYIVGGVSLAATLLTLAYHVGRLSARVDSLEEWRRETKSTFDTLHGALRHIESLITGSES